MTHTIRMPGYAVLGILLFTAGAQAQSLDQAVARQLRADCGALGGENPTYFGADLNAICSQLFGSPNGTANSGQGGASSQTMAVSVENRRKTQLEDQPESELADRFGVFVNANGETLDKDRSAFADAFDSTVKSASLGVDYRVANNFLVGAAYVYRNNTGDFESGGDFDTTGNGATLYMSITPSAKSFLDLSVSYTDKSYEIRRRAQFTEFDNGGNTNNFDGIVNSDSDGTEQGVQALFGYDFGAGRFTVGPRLGFSWSRTEIDEYAESGGGAGNQLVNGRRGAAGLALVYQDQRVHSTQGSLGGQASLAFTQGFGVLVVQGNADYVREFEADQRLVQVRFVQDRRPSPTTFEFQTEKPAEDFFKAGVSLVAVFQGGLQSFLNVQTMLGNEQFDSYAATLGVRFEL